MSYKPVRSKTITDKELQRVRHGDLIESHRYRLLVDEIDALRDALQIAVGHSNCYCSRCRAISGAYFSPTKAMEEKP